MKKRLSFAKMYGVLKTAAPTKKRLLNMPLVDEAGQLTPSGRAALSAIAKSGKGDDQTVIDTFQAMLVKAGVSPQAITKIRKGLGTLLTNVPTTLLVQMRFDDESLRQEALLTLLDPSNPAKRIPLALTTSRGNVQLQVENINERLFQLNKMGIINPAYVRGNMLFTGSVGDRGGIGASSNVEIQNPVKLYQGSFSQLLIDMLESAKQNPQTAVQQGKQKGKELISKIQNDPNVPKAQKDSWIRSIINGIMNVMSRIPGIGKAFKGQAPNTRTTTPPTAPTTKTPPTASLGLIMTHRLYKNAARLGKTPIQAVVSKYLRGITDALGKRVKPEEVKVLLGPDLEEAGTLNDIFAKGINFQATSMTRSGDLKFDIALQHPLFAALPNLGVFKAVAHNIQKEYEDDVKAYEQTNDGEIVKMTFTLMQEGFQEKDPATLRAPGYETETSASRGVERGEVTNLFYQFLKLSQGLDTKLQEMATKSPEAALALRIILAIRVYKGIPGARGQEIADVLHILADSDGLGISATPEGLLQALMIHANEIVAKPNMKVLLSKVPEVGESVITFDPQKAAESLEEEGAKKQGVPGVRVVINPRRSGQGGYRQKIEELNIYMNHLKTAYPNNKALQLYIQEVEKRVKNSLEGARAGGEGTDRLTTLELQKIKATLEKLI